MTRLVLLLVLSLVVSVTAQTESHFGSRVFFLGESHTSERDHQGQLEVLKRLNSPDDDRPILLVCEMFNELSEGKVQDFLQAPSTDEAKEFWEAQWGHPFELYQPIFEWALTQGIPVTHLRPDPARVKTLKQDGPLSALEPLGEFFLGPAAYREHMKDIVDAHMPEGSEAPESMVNSFFLVQCFWDEYMAWRVCQLAEQFPNHRLVVLVGHGHLYREYGIPLRLKRRAPALTAVTVGFTENADWQPVWVVPIQHP